MAKMRGIKPETFTDDKFLQLTPLARLLFIGMWTEACDNGHVEDNAVQLKVRLLPMDSCDVSDLLAEIINTGQVTRHDGYLKVVKLTEHQRIDRRYLLFCEWCSHDVHTTFDPSDKAPRTTSTQRVHDVHPSGTQRVHVDEGEGEKKVRGDEVPRSRAATGTRVDPDFTVTDEMRQWANSKGYGRMDLDAITESFVDYWLGKAGKDGRKVDWLATWRNWVKRDADGSFGGRPRAVGANDRSHLPEAWR